MEFALSDLDEACFGVRTAKALVDDVKEVGDVLGRCRRGAVRLLIVRCPVGAVRAVQALERAGGLLTDTLVSSVRDLRQPLPPADDARCRLATPADSDGIVEIAGACFSTYGGHYHADPRLDRARCRDVYLSWARRCCERRAANAVLVLEDEGSVLAFLAVRRDGDGAQGVLTAVRPDRHGEGLHWRLLIHAMAWCASDGAARMLGVTQIWNFAIQRSWVRLGFEPAGATHTVHVWLDE